MGREGGVEIVTKRGDERGSTTSQVHCSGIEETAAQVMGEGGGGVGRAGQLQGCAAVVPVGVLPVWVPVWGRFAFPFTGFFLFSRCADPIRSWRVVRSQRAHWGVLVLAMLWSRVLRSGPAPPVQTLPASG